MQKVAIIQISEEGARVADVLRQELNGVLIQRSDVAGEWSRFDAFIFIGAMGICVRTIAPLMTDKHDDPAVVCVDTFGRHVITTQSDNAGLWALDTMGAANHWHTSTTTDFNTIIAKFVNREPTALLLDMCDRGTELMERTMPSHVTIVSSVDAIVEQPRNGNGITDKIKRKREIGKATHQQRNL